MSWSANDLKLKKAQPAFPGAEQSHESGQVRSMAIWSLWSKCLQGFNITCSFNNDSDQKKLLL